MLTSTTNGFTNKNSLIDKLPLENTRQAMIVKSTNITDMKITFEAYEKDDNNQWNLILSTNGVVGKNGMSPDRHEGDMTTPEGIFGFLFEFGIAPNPGTNMEYRQIHPNDYWSSVPSEEEYNTWVTYQGDPEERFGSDKYEALYHIPLYKYGAALDFNYGSNKIIGKGTAIFFHIAPYSGGGTAGCVGIPEAELVEVLKWMTPEKNPKIIIGTEDYLKNLKH